MAITANSRGMLALRATTALPPLRTLAVVRSAATAGEAAIRGGLSRGGPPISPIAVEQETTERLLLVLRSGPSATLTCAFSAWVRRAATLTTLRVGDLERTGATGFLAWGPACSPTTADWQVYREFLHSVAAGLWAADADAHSRIGAGI